jgi:pimeloyl-ACP methyl ester carboxylesterase
MALQLNYKHFGSSTPLIILHGLFGSLDNWQTLGRKFAEHFSVYLIDQRNHGRSPHTKHHNFQLMADDLFDFMQQHDLDKAHLIGHSMGGKTVMQFSINHPEKVLKQIIVDIAPKQYPRGHDDIFKAIFSLNLSEIQKRDEADAQLEKMIPEFAVRQFIMKNLERNADTGMFEWKMNLELLYREYDNICEAITSGKTTDAETLVVRGSKSKYVSDADINDFKKLFSKVAVADISGAGHWVHAEAPKEFLTVANNFLLSE